MNRTMSVKRIAHRTCRPCRHKNMVTDATHTVSIRHEFRHCTTTCRLHLCKKHADQAVSELGGNPS